MKGKGIGTRIIKAQRLALRLQKLWTNWRGTSGQVYFEHRVSEYREMWKAVAREINAQFRLLAPDIWELELNGAVTRINNHQLEFDDPVTLLLAGQKPLVHRLLKEKGLQVPEHTTFTLRELDKAYSFLSKNPRGCVIKPADGYGGKGVTTHVLDENDARKASILASLYCPEILIEAQIPGESYRLLVLDGKMAHAVCRRGPRLTGDGKSKVSGLINSDNERRRKQGAQILDVDRDCMFTLSCQGLTLDSVPASGRPFLVKSVNDSRKQKEVRTVYNEVVTDLVCPSIRMDAEVAAKVLGSDFAGVDIITTDPTLPLEETGGVINEVNTTPALHHHYDARKEQYPKVAIPVIMSIFEKKRAFSALKAGLK